MKEERRRWREREIYRRQRKRIGKISGRVRRKKSGEKREKRDNGRGTSERKREKRDEREVWRKEVKG